MSCRVYIIIKDDTRSNFNIATNLNKLENGFSFCRFKQCYNEEYGDNVKVNIDTSDYDNSKIDGVEISFKNNTCEWQDWLVEAIARTLGKVLKLSDGAILKYKTEFEGAFNECSFKELKEREGD